jgi:hypothetical protein
VVGLAASSASAVPQASGGKTPHLVLHGTGGLHPDIRLRGEGRLAANPAGIPIQYSGNWSGYIALPKSKHATAFRYVQGDFTVPSVNCTSTPYAFAYFWAGLDGDTDSTVEQDGVGSFCVNGSPAYFAWSEMFPAGVQIQFNLNPGDEVISSVFYNSSAHLYSLGLTDETSGQTFGVNQACAATAATPRPRSSPRATVIPLQRDLRLRLGELPDHQGDRQQWPARRADQFELEH